MVKKSKPPYAKFKEWASSLVHIETLADAACYTDPTSQAHKELLRRLIRESRTLREAFVRQVEKGK